MGSKTRDKLKSKQPLNIICYGDSMTWGYNDDPNSAAGHKSPNNYPSVLQAKLRYIYRYNQINVVNKGVSGCTSTEGLAGFQNQIIRDMPDLLIMMWGLNDAIYIDTAQFIQNMRNMIQMAKDNNIEVMLATQVPIISRDIGRSYNCELYDLENKNFAKAITYLAQEQNVDLVDVYSEMNRLFCNNAIGSEFYESGGHPLDYTLIADIFIANNLGDIYQPYREDNQIIRCDTNQVHATASRKTTNDSAIFSKKFYALGSDLPNEKIVAMVYASKKNSTIDFIMLGNPNGGTVTLTNFGTPIAVLNSYSALENPNMVQSITLSDAGLYFLELKGINVEPTKLFKSAGFVYNDIDIIKNPKLVIPLNSSRGTVKGGYIKNGRIVTLTLKLTTVVVAGPSVFIVEGLPQSLFDAVGFICKNEATSEDIPVGFYSGNIFNKNTLPIGTYIISGSYITQY